MSGFGLAAREAGHDRVPAPPQRTRGAMLVVCGFDERLYD